MWLGLGSDTINTCLLRYGEVLYSHRLCLDNRPGPRRFVNGRPLSSCCFRVFEFLVLFESGLRFFTFFVFAVFLLPTVRRFLREFRVLHPSSKQHELEGYIGFSLDACSKLNISQDRGSKSRLECRERNYFSSERKWDEREAYVFQVYKDLHCVWVNGVFIVFRLEIWVALES